jgi:hypothetical protein
LVNLFSVFIVFILIFLLCYANIISLFMYLWIDFTFKE